MGKHTTRISRAPATRVSARDGRSLNDTRPGSTAGSAARIPLWLLAALVIPRLVRALYPEIWVEDDQLMENAFAVARGLRPYLDFSHAQLPVLEWVAGAYVRAIGASELRMELLNGAAIYATSVLVFCLAQRALDRRAAIAAALLYSCSSLVFRYHVWAREYFVSVCVLAAVLLVVGDRSRPWRTAVIVACLSLACAIKLTAAVSVGVIVVFIAVGVRQVSRAVTVAAGTSLALTALFCSAYWAYGFPFVFQTVLFHFFKGRDPSRSGLTYPAQLFDVLVPLAALGIAGLWRRPLSPALSLVALAGGALYLFYGMLSPTAWGHNYLELLPFLAVLAGAGCVWLIDAYRRSWGRFAAGVAVIAASLAWVAPLRNENAERDSVYGFGFVPRRELAELAGAVRAASRPDEEVIAPSFIAFEANRLPLVRYPENLGVMRATEAEYLAHGFLATRERYGTRSFFDVIDSTSAIWNDLVISGIAEEGPVNCIILDAAIQFIPLVNATPEALAARGFRARLRTAHYELWVRPPP